jgi:hypothetical protein
MPRARPPRRDSFQHNTIRRNRTAPRAYRHDIAASVERHRHAGLVDNAAPNSAVNATTSSVHVHATRPRRRLRRTHR